MLKKGYFKDLRDLQARFQKKATRMVIFPARVKLARVNITDLYHARAELLVNCENYQFSGLKNVTQRF